MVQHLPYNPSVPLYYQVSRLLRMRIEAGTISKDGRLPSELVLCRESGVSRTTLRQALGLLKTQGILNGRRGVGNFVLGGAAPGRMVRASGDPLHHGLGTRVRVVSIDHVPAPDRVSGFLRLPQASAVLRAIRVHMTGRAPLSVVITYLPPDLAQGITRSNLLRTSLQEILWRAHGLALARSVHTIRVQRADETIAPLLEVPLMDPVLHIQSENYLDSGRPIRFTDNYFREDRYQYTAEMLWRKPGGAAAAGQRRVPGQTPRQGEGRRKP